jgi:hypothetical protein
MFFDPKLRIHDYVTRYHEVMAGAFAFCLYQGGHIQFWDLRRLLITTFSASFSELYNHRPMSLLRTEFGREEDGVHDGVTLDL